MVDLVISGIIIIIGYYCIFFESIFHVFAEIVHMQQETLRSYGFVHHAMITLYQLDRPGCVQYQSYY